MIKRVLNKNKLKSMYQTHFKLSVLEVALCGIFVGLWIVSYKFISLNFGFMKLGITYSLAITIGLIFKPMIGLLTIIIADNLTLLLTNLSHWMIEYALIYPLIVLLVSLLKRIFKLKNDKLWCWLVILIIGVMIGITSTISLIYKSFINSSKQADTNFNFSLPFVAVLVWIMMLGIVGYTLFALWRYFKTKNEKIKSNLSIFIITSLIIIIFIWVWGPIAQIQYLARHFKKNRWDLFRSYDLFLIPRILKTPIVLPIYYLLTYSMFNAYNLLKLSHNQFRQW